MNTIKIDCHDCLILVKKMYLIKIPYFKNIFDEKYKQPNPDDILDFNYTTANPISLIKIINFYKGQDIEFEENDNETLIILGIKEPLVHDKKPHEIIMINKFNLFLQKSSLNPLHQNIGGNKVTLHDYNTMQTCEITYDSFINIQKKDFELKFPEGIDVINELLFYINTTLYNQLITGIKIYNESNILLCEIFEDQIEQTNFEESEVVMIRVLLYNRFPYFCKLIQKINIQLELSEFGELCNGYTVFTYIAGVTSFKEKLQSIVESRKASIQQMSDNSSFYIIENAMNVFEIVIILKEGNFNDIEEIQCSSYKDNFIRFTQIDIYLGRRYKKLPNNVIILKTPHLMSRYASYLGLNIIGKYKIKYIYSNFYNTLFEYNSKTINKAIMM